jgi:hypothetical protein
VLVYKEIINMNDNILFLSHEQVSHAYDTFFNGCMALFGPENVFDCPSLPKHHSDYKHSHTYAWWCYNDTGHVLSLPIEEWAKQINMRKVKYIVGSNRAIPNFIQLISLINEDVFKDICVIFLEEEEDPGFNIHRWCLEALSSVYNRIDIHYKADYVTGRVGAYEKILPFYLSAPQSKIMGEIGSVKPFSEREIDICYIVGASHANRKKYYDIIKNANGNNIVEYGTHKYNITEYFNAVNNSKIFISVRGNGWGNTRNAEGPICGAALFSESLEITVPFDYKDGVSAVFFDETNILSKLNEYVANPKKLAKLAKASYSHCIDNHTSLARAKQMTQQAKKIKGW